MNAKEDKMILKVIEYKIVCDAPGCMNTSRGAPTLEAVVQLAEQDGWRVLRASKVVCPDCCARVQESKHSSQADD